MRFVAIGLFVIATLNAFSQDQRTYSDEEITQYARVMVWAELEKSRMTNLYNEWINTDENLGAPKFLKIKQAKGDSVKLAEMGIADVEISAYMSIIASYDSMTSSFVDVYKGKIREEISAGLYNSLAADLKKSAALKSRYDKIFNDLMQGTKQDEIQE